MKRPTTTYPTKGDPVGAVKSDLEPEATIDQPAPDIDFNQPRMLLKIEFLKRSKLCREHYEKLKQDLELLEREAPERTSSGELIIRPGRSYTPAEILGRPEPEFPEFEEWLEGEVKKEDEDRKSPFWGDPVEDMKGHLSLFIENARTDFSKKNSRDPSIEELKTHLDSMLSSPAYGNSFFLFTQFIYGTRKEYDTILNGVAELLKQKMPKKRFMEEELKRYLRVYDLREMGMKWKDIYFKIYPQHKGEEFTDNARRALYMDKEKAEKAIKKLEKDEYFWWS